MGRKQQFTTQRLSIKPQSAKTLGGGDEGQTVILLEPEDKPEDNRSAIDFERNDDFDEDDDLDNRKYSFPKFSPLNFTISNKCKSHYLIH